MDNFTNDKYIDEKDSLKTSNYYVAFLDILGAKDYMLQDGNKFLNDISNIYTKSIKLLNNIETKLKQKINIKIFSDNILLAIKLNKKEEFAKEGKYTTIDKLPEDWPSYKVQEKQNEISSPSENSIRLAEIYHNRDVVEADKELKDKEVSILEKGLQKKALANNTVMPDELEKMIKKDEKMKEKKEELI